MFWYLKKQNNIQMTSTFLNKPDNKTWIASVDVGKKTSLFV